MRMPRRRPDRTCCSRPACGRRKPPTRPRPPARSGRARGCCRRPGGRGCHRRRRDTLYLALVYLMTADEQGSYPSLTLEGKRRWLRQFWMKRDPSAGTARNEAREDFYARIAEANRRFREGGSAQIPGWRTDRGRGFIKYGPPHEGLDRPQAGKTRPYVGWKFTRGRVLKDVFLD